MTVQSELLVIFKGQDKTLSSTADKIGGKFGTLGSKMKAGLKVGQVALVAMGAVAIPAGKKLLDMGSDAEETANLLKESLGPATDGYTASIKAMAEESGRSFFELQEGSATLVAMSKGMGATEQQAAGLGSAFAGMAIDLGSFFNVSDDQVFADLQSALGGSSETMQKYGIDIRETTLKQMALNAGLIETTTGILPPLIRAQMIQQAITTQGADAMGDAARTSGSYANQMKALKAAFHDAGVEAGQALLPLATQFLQTITPFVRDVLPKLVEWFTKWHKVILGVMAAFAGAVIIGTVISWIAGLVSAITTLIPIITGAGAAVSGVVAILGGPFTLIIGAVIALVAGFALAWKNNWFGIRDTTAVVVDALKAFWNDKLLPALKSVWQFLTVDMIPVWKALGVLLFGPIILAIKALKAAWDAVLLPALKIIWNFVRNDMMPVWKALENFLKVVLPAGIQFYRDAWNRGLDTMRQVVDVVRNNLGPAFDWFKRNILDNAVRGLQVMIGIVNSVASAVRALAYSLSTLVLPAAFTPGSPTPFELGLRGIRKELDGLYRSDLPALQTGMQNLQNISTRNTTFNQTTNVYTSQYNPRFEQQAEAQFLLGGI